MVRFLEIMLYLYITDYLRYQNNNSYKEICFDENSKWYRKICIRALIIFFMYNGIPLVVIVYMYITDN